MGPGRTSPAFLPASVLFLLLVPFGVSFPGLRGCVYFFPQSEESLPRVQKDSAVYLKAAGLFRASPEVTARLGRPLVEGEPEGETFPPFKDLLELGDFPGAPFAHFTVPVSGPSGQGKIHAVANYLQGDWRFSALSLAPEGSTERINLLPPPPPEDLPLRGRGTVYLLPLGPRRHYTLDGLPEYFQARFGIPVVVLPEVPLDSSVRSPQEHNAQAVEAELLIERMKQAHPELANDADAFLIGITEKQMGAEAYGWSETFNLREHMRYAVISAQMGPWTPAEAANPEVIQVRLRKVLLRNLGFFYFKLQQSRDPRTVLLPRLGSTATIDLMAEEFVAGPGGWQPFEREEAPCVSVTRYPDGRTAWLDGYEMLLPSDTGLQRFSFCPGFGMFAAQQVDFLLPEPFPLALRRLYRTKDDQPRAFGVGHNHSLDIFLVGSAPRWVELVLEDGGRVRFERAPSPPGRPTTFFREDTQGHEFSGATMEWNGSGWDLERRDGWIFTFPASQRATRSAQAALTGIRHRDGRAFRVERDEEANLRLVETPSGEALRFDYDAAGRLRRITHSGGRWVEYGYDRDGRLARVRDSDGQGAAYGYDSKGQMVRVEIPAGRVFLRNEYDEQGWLVQQTFADGKVFRYSYERADSKDDKPTQITVTDPEGFVTRIERTPGGYVSSLPEPLKP